MCVGLAPCVLYCASYDPYIALGVMVDACVEFGGGVLGGGCNIALVTIQTRVWLTPNINIGIPVK